jgi:hypothetical protein
MYESPITKICANIIHEQTLQEEDMVFKAIQKCNIEVNKEELIKALKYDRNQYNKGYEDGIKDVLTMLWLFDQQNVIEIIDKYKTKSEDVKE